MTEAAFKTQMQRLRNRFGERNFDNEFVLLVWREVKSMSDQAFERACDTFIGHRQTNKPPLLAEFREARLAAEKYAVERDTQGACKVLKHPAVAKPLAEVLRRDFGAVESVKDALEIARLRHKINPSDKDGA